MELSKGKSREELLWLAKSESGLKLLPFVISSTLYSESSKFPISDVLMFDEGESWLFSDLKLEYPKSSKMFSFSFLWDSENGVADGGVSFISDTNEAWEDENDKSRLFGSLWFE